MALAALLLETMSLDEFELALETCDGLTIHDSNRNTITLRLNDFLDENIKNAFITVWNLIGKGLTKNADAYPIWKKIKDGMKDDSILQHEEACKALEPTLLRIIIPFLEA